jgi:hypothetical protein
MEWQVILALVIGIPIILFVPLLVWVVVVSGVYQVARDRLRRRVTVTRRKAATPVEETVTHEVT